MIPPNDLTNNNPAGAYARYNLIYNSLQTSSQLQLTVGNLR